ncbi:hypothetical protein GGQ57_002769 [Parabacteroides faecis]|jgi:hypothetical protein|uniref:Uncharacterized protein n=1 Tax=Parabacteroides faecis TaxID=1217282 RepID=A0ABR6KMX1_9BACT|nr:hypothetical protein [Parabacteroides faecis]
MIFGLWNYGMTMKKYGTYIDIFFYRECSDEQYKP